MFKGVPNEIIGMKWVKPWKFLIKRRENFNKKERERDRERQRQRQTEREQ